MSNKLYLAVVAVMALLLAGCAGVGAPAGSDTPTTPQEETTQVEESEPAAPGEKVTLTIESWRTDDVSIWEDVIIPAFNEQFPDIEVQFVATNPPDYDSALNAKLEGGAAGDLITCRPFDRSLGLYEEGNLAAINDLPGLENFGDVAKSAWITDDGSDIFCVPMASVIHGFIYNADAFAELGLEEPVTEAEFYEVLETIKADGTYDPLAMGTIDQWEAATMGFQNIGPNYWQGEEGRLGLIAGAESYSDPQYVAVWDQLAKWSEYLPSGYEAQSYSDSQNLFTLGRSAIYPSGSWEISLFNDQSDFEMGAFPPPLPEGSDTCYISDHTDIALGMNPATEHPNEAKAFLEWMTTPEFAELYANQLPGFFSLSNHSISLDDPLAQEFVDWRGECESTIRNSYQILSRGEPNLETELWRISALVMNGELTPEEAGQEIQAGLEKWYTPGGAMEEEAAAPSEEVALEAATLTIESWRTDDVGIWEDVIIPAFNEQFPDIEVQFVATNPPDYDSALNAKLEGGAAGDLITCRPFDRSLGLYEEGNLAAINDLPGLENFGDVAKSAWITDDGSDIFCVPMASVIHGFIYNADAFAELGLEEPVTEAEFYEVLETIKADGTYDPLAMGTIDQWEAATMGFQNIGPNYWQGEEGRLGLIAGAESYSDPQYVAVWDQLAKWSEYLPSGYEAQSYSDSQNLFTLGRSAIYPSGSWEISLFNDQSDFEMGAFPPPLPEGSDTCYISDHTDIALGMNPATEHPNEAKAFLEWMTTPEFAELYANQLPGFFSLSNHSISLDDPLAQEFVDWRGECESTIRNSYQILSRGEPNLETELWRISALVMNGELTPEEAGQEIQAGLDKWYEPQ